MESTTYGVPRTAVRHRPPNGLRLAPAARDARGGEVVLGTVPLADGTSVVLVGRLPADGSEAGAAVQDGPLTIDPATWSASVDGLPLDLTHQEFVLLHLLAAAPRRVFSRAEILRIAWPVPHSSGTRTVDVHVSRLRRKLGRLGPRLRTVRNVGYTYRPDPA
ncbi:winged helix-turn-helix domain-containing protein [Nocardiopsis coralliicola]